MARGKAINRFQDELCDGLVREIKGKLLADGTTIAEFALLAKARYGDVVDALNGERMDRPTLAKAIRWARAAGLKVAVVAVPGVELGDRRDMQAEILRCWRALGRPRTLDEIEDRLSVPSNVIALRRAGFEPRRRGDGSE